MVRCIRKVIQGSTVRSASRTRMVGSDATDHQTLVSREIALIDREYARQRLERVFFTRFFTYIILKLLDVLSQVLQVLQ